MNYYWSHVINGGIFRYWETKDEKSLLKSLKQYYKDEDFEYGETVQTTYSNAKKFGSADQTE